MYAVHYIPNQVYTNQPTYRAAARLIGFPLDRLTRPYRL